MKSVVNSLLVVCLMVVASAHAQVVDQFYDTARVINVQPMMQQVPQQSCTQQPVQYVQPAQRSNQGGLIGGIAGALLGAQVGNGNGRIAAAAAGGVVGAMTGDRLDNRDNTSQIVQGTTNVCNTVYVTQQNGFMVTFDYNGHQGQQHLSYDPGQAVRVTVTVAPQ